MIRTRQTARKKVIVTPVPVESDSEESDGSDKGVKEDQFMDTKCTKYRGPVSVDDPCFCCRTCKSTIHFSCTGMLKTTLLARSFCLLPRISHFSVMDV